MKLKVFTLRPDPATGAFDDSALVAFLENHEALAVHEHFYLHEQQPTWALLVSYRATPERPWSRPFKAPTPAEPSEEVSPADRPLYEALRRWRNARAKRDGRPAYVLFSNRQLLEMVQRRPATLAALQEIGGIGEGRAGDFGKEILGLVKSHAASEKPQADADAGSSANTGSRSSADTGADDAG
jgi:superfamily II DNA helicase RecQ